MSAVVSPFSPPTLQQPTGSVWQRALLEPLWVSYKLTPDGAKPKPKKMPYGKGGSPKEWNRHTMTYADATAQAAKLRHDGVGYLPKPGSALAVVDFDNVLLDPALAKQAHGWIAKGGYWELSSSGTGYHAIIPRPRDAEWTMDNAQGWLGYLGSGSKFCAFTFQRVAGDRLVPVPGIMEALEAVRALPAGNTATEPSSMPLREQWWLRTDPGVVRAAIEELLTHIDLPPTSDGARRDTWVKIGLSLKSTGNPWAEAAFTEWSQGQPGYVSDEDVADNWRRLHPDGSMTLQTAIWYAKQNGFDPAPFKAKAQPIDDAEKRERIKRLLGMGTEAGGGTPPKDGDADVPDVRAQAARFNEPTFVLDHYLPRGVCTTFFGKDGVGKSYLALQVALHVATGRPFMGRTPTQGRVEMFSVEDPLDVIAQRFRAIDSAYRFTDDEIRDISRNMPDLLTRDYVRMDDTRLITFDKDGTPQQTLFMQLIVERLKLTRPQLVVFDPISDIFADDENSRAKVAPFMRMMNALAAELNMAVLLLGHPAKAEESEYSGSGAWSSKSRSRWFFEAPDKAQPNLITLTHKKASWGPLAPEQAFHRTSGGVLLPMSTDEQDARKYEAEEPVRVLIVDTIRAAGRANETCSAASNQTHHIGRMVVDMNRVKDLAPAYVMTVAKKMMQEGLLAVMDMDGEGGRPRIMGNNRTPRRGLWIV